MILIKNNLWKLDIRGGICLYVSYLIIVIVIGLVVMDIVGKRLDFGFKSGGGFKVVFF